MGIPDSSLLDLIEKVRSWISWGSTNLQCVRGRFEMPHRCSKMCSECHNDLTGLCHRYHCQLCGRWFCGQCILGYESVILDAVKNEVKVGEGLMKYCKICSDTRVGHECGRKHNEKVHPSASPRESPEPPSPCFSGKRVECFVNSELMQSDNFAPYLEARECGYSPHATNASMTSFSAHSSPVSVRQSLSRSDEEAEDSLRHFLSPSSEYCHDNSDIDSSSVSARHEFYGLSVGSSPNDSPSRIEFTSVRVGQTVQRRQGESPVSQNDGHPSQETMPVLKRPGTGTEDSANADDCSDDISIFRSQCEKSKRPLDFENNGLIWFPPPPEDDNNEAESGFFSYDDEDDEVGDSGVIFSTNSSLSSLFPAKEKQNEGNKEPLRVVVHGHFRALVSQLLQGEGINIGKENEDQDWLDIVTTIAWQAASFVKPDTSGGGSMDPGDYVKVKRVATGSPSDSTFVRGVVCTKNIKHKRMTSQYKNARLLILGGALEYQRVPNQLASFDTLLQQENDHLKMIISKIEALRPNVLLVEKSVSPKAQEYLLAKEISLVLNVKRPLLERIARCTGALIAPSIDKISTARLGNCELFRLEKVSEQHETANQLNKKPSKTLMFFEGCPRRLGCTVLLKGGSREELKKIKNVVQYGIFAAYHLSLETSFLADEGATLPKMMQGQTVAIHDRATADLAISSIPGSLDLINLQAQYGESVAISLETEGSEPFTGHFGPGQASDLSSSSMDCVFKNVLHGAAGDYLTSNAGFNSIPYQYEDKPTASPSDVRFISHPEALPIDARQSKEIQEVEKCERMDGNDISSEYFSAADSHQSILVSFSSHCVKGTVCERSRLMRIKFYGCFDKPLGGYLRDDLFDQTSCCRSCKEPAEAHLIRYTHQQGNLSINVRRLPSLKLPGERDGKIWMWHRCLKCALVDGVPPATRRVVMSDAAWGLSFGKFLELSFSNHATANRVATCGHSLQRDCLRYYGFGSMVAFFRYSPIDILSVQLPPSVLEFNSHIQPEWIRNEATEVMGKMETLYAEISDILDSLEDKSKCFSHEFSDASELQYHVLELKDLVKKERNDYIALLQPAIMENMQPGQMVFDILELNRLRHSLLIGSHLWDRQLYSLDSLLNQNSISKTIDGGASLSRLKHLTNNSSSVVGSLDCEPEKNVSEFPGLQDVPAQDLMLECKEKDVPPSEPHDTEDSVLVSCPKNGQEELKFEDGEIIVDKTAFESSAFHESTLTDRIDSAWTGTEQLQAKAQLDGLQGSSMRQVGQNDNPPFRRLRLPGRVNSLDSVLRVQERIRKGLPPSSLHLSTLRSFHAYGEYRSMIRDPVSSVTRTYSQLLPQEVQKFNLAPSSTHSFITSASLIAEGVRLLLPHSGQSDIVVAVYDNEPTSIICYALSSKDYDDWVADKSIEHEGVGSSHDNSGADLASSTFPSWQSFGSIDLDYIHYGNYGSDDVPSSMGSLFSDTKRSPHLRLSFGDDSSTAGGKVKFSVTCYFAKQFDSLRKNCCPSDVDFVRSLSRCRRWSAQGGKSNVYFAKSFDERFIIKQVTKTELESFEEFAPEYFKYMTSSLCSGSPSCLAKVLGIYQVSVKHQKGGKETKMDLMIMENLFYKRSISRVYDLKGSSRSRYIPDTTGTNKVLLDTNLLETLRTKPIFLGSKAKRSLERAIWNDTSFLASVDVMDYSLLVGVDEERKELVLGIIDFMRQYTWDKHLETWVKASGILGGPKNTSPTIVSPKQYKKRFRKAMTTYFLTVPDQWSS